METKLLFGDANSLKVKRLLRGCAQVSQEGESRIEPANCEPIPKQSEKLHRSADSSADKTPNRMYIAMQIDITPVELTYENSPNSSLQNHPLQQTRPLIEST